MHPPVAGNPATHTSHVLIGNWGEDRAFRQATLQGLNCTETGKEQYFDTVQRTSYRGDKPAGERDVGNAQVLKVRRCPPPPPPRPAHARQAANQRTTLVPFATPRALSHTKRPHGYEEHDPYVSSTQAAYT